MPPIEAIQAPERASTGSPLTSACQMSSAGNSGHDVPVPGLSPAHDGIKIAHLTDLHVGMLTPDKKILRAIDHARHSKPDLVLLTGDFVCYSPRFVGKLREIIRGRAARS